VTQPVTDRLKRSTQLIIAHIVVLGRILHSFGTVHWVPLLKGTYFNSHREMYRFLLYNFLTYLLTYLLTTWSRVLLEKLTGLQLVKKFFAFHGNRKFITALTSARHLSLS
jgi:hypothetical protein